MDDADDAGECPCQLAFLSTFHLGTLHQNCYTRAMLGPGEVVLYSRKGCHLCQIVKESLAKLDKHARFTWREIDVDSDPDVRRLYTDEVPVSPKPNLERATGIEPVTSGLGSRRSTAELRPLDLVRLPPGLVDDKL